MLSLTLLNQDSKAPSRYTEHVAPVATMHIAQLRPNAPRNDKCKRKR